MVDFLVVTTKRPIADCLLPSVRRARPSMRQLHHPQHQMHVSPAVRVHVQTPRAGAVARMVRRRRLQLLQQRQPRPAPAHHPLAALRLRHRDVQPPPRAGAHAPLVGPHLARPLQPARLPALPAGGPPARGPAPALYPQRHPGPGGARHWPARGAAWGSSDGKVL